MHREPLLQLLDSHRPADAREAAHRAVIRDMVARTDAPFSRAQMEPGHVTASAFVLAPDGGEVLLIHHAKLGLWLQPGGHVDPDDEDVVAAARREVHEETSLSDLELEPGFPFLLDVDVHDIPANPRKGEGPHQHHDVRLVFRARDRAVQAGSDALAAKWVALERVRDAGTDDSVRRAIRKLMERGA